MSFLSFEETNKFEIELVGVAESEYEAKLKTAYENGEMPDIFRTEYLSEENADLMCADVSLYYFYFPTEEYYLIEKDKSELIKQKVIPTNFVIPVAYANNSLLAKSGNDTPKMFSSTADMEYDIAKLTAKYDTQYCTLYNERVIDNLSEIFSIDGSQLKNSEAVRNSAETPMQIFTGENAVIYVGFSDEIVEVQNSDALKGIYSTVPITGDRIVAEYSELYGIASTSSLNKKRLSMLFLSYLASASSEGGMPLNKSSFDEYVESNSQFFGFLNEYTNEELGVKYIDCAVTGVEPSEVQNEQ